MEMKKDEFKKFVKCKLTLYYANKWLINKNLKDKTKRYIYMLYYIEILHTLLAAC